MLTTPTLTQWLGDRDRQRRSAEVGGAAISRWAEAPAVARFRKAIRALGADTPCSAADLAERMRPWCDDRRWLDVLIHEAVGALRQDGFAELPLTLRSGSLVKGLMLADDGNASAALTIVAADRLAGWREEGLILEGGYSLILLVNQAPLTVDHYRLTGDKGQPVDVRRRTLGAGEWLAVDCGSEQIRMVAAERDAVVLRVAVGGAAANGVIRQVDPRTGQCVSVGVADPALSRTLALIDVAGLAPVAEATPALKQFARHGDHRVRWASMRGLLAANRTGAMPLLRTMQRSDPHPQLRQLASVALQHTRHAGSGTMRAAG